MVSGTNIEKNSPDMITEVITIKKSALLLKKLTVNIAGGKESQAPREFVGMNTLRPTKIGKIRNFAEVFLKPVTKGAIIRQR